MSSTIRSTIVVLTAAAGVACVSSQSQPPLAITQPCGIHTCRVSVINHQANALMIIYKDSTGRSQHAGRLAGASTLAMNVVFVHSAGIRVFAIDGDHNIFATDFTFPRSGPMDINFPDDFVAVDDTIMPRRAPH